MKAVCASFPPVIGPACRILILGSVPGVVSLRAAQYYAHPRNAFWPILYALWDQETPDKAYEDRLAFALFHGIALWDAARVCRREASSDATIRDAKPNDFAALFAQYSAIHTIFCNGRQAYALFNRLARDAAGGRCVALLPSTSPAHTLPFAEKLAAWRAVRAAVEEGFAGR